MKTMRNEYRDLKKENDLIFSTLAEYDRDTITEIISVVDNTWASDTRSSWCARI